LSLGDSDPKKRYTKSNVIIDESNYEQQEKKIKKKSATTNKIMRMRRRRSDSNVMFENNLGFESCPRVLDQRPTRHMISWAKSLLKGLCLPAQVKPKPY